MNKLKSLFIAILFLVLFIPFNTKALEEIRLYLFHQEGCPHCEAEIEFLESIEDDYPNLEIIKYEVSGNAMNYALYNKVMKKTKIYENGVPFTMIGTDYHVGFDENTGSGDAIKKSIEKFSKGNYKDIILMVKNDEDLSGIKYNEDLDAEKTIPILGKINAKSVSLPLVAIIMGAIDGFNPCAMWVLLFLITMLFNMKDKKKMWILGLTFIGTSAFIYFLFMMAWLKTSDFMNSIKTLQLIVGIFSIIFGSFNLYKYFKERKEDGCTVIKKEKRKLVFGYIKKVIENKYFILALIGIMTLAVIVNLIELLCSLGLPVMFTEILSLNHLSSNIYFTYIGLYILFFMLDDIIIFTLSMVTLKSKAISTKYNKYSHLIGGIIMLIIGLLIILKPEWLAFSFN